ncbi:hypothetical protein EX30DRAFT_43111 [Ascodesmis nigricans]|uniref:Uncharacterized protein n=1 Tax=Ascodesmis nigricans TaxID=341454 RepID=A0A4S2MW97_9PEZI|nr:hypothetical protein EX30DRAFT_43111 [Ascodesmis nigricans]
MRPATGGHDGTIRSPVGRDERGRYLRLRLRLVGVSRRQFSLATGSSSTKQAVAHGSYLPWAWIASRVHLSSMYLVYLIFGSSLSGSLIAFSFSFELVPNSNLHETFAITNRPSRNHSYEKKKKKNLYFPPRYSTW